MCARAGPAATCWFTTTIDRRLDGGSGHGTRRPAGSGLTLDLTAVSILRITGIERIDLTGTGDNALALAPGDLQDLAASSSTLLVAGNAGDSVSSTGRGWALDPGGPVRLRGQPYNSYTPGVARLPVDADIAQLIT
jgi:hypothetical protein